MEEHLQALRAQRFAPRASVRFVRQVAACVRRDLLANPGAVRSIGTLALAYFAAAFVAAIALAFAFERDLAEHFLLDTSLWMLASFAVVMLLVGMLRDERGFRLSGLNVPLMLTLLRVALVPGTCLLLVQRHFALALFTYVIACLSDVLDGFLARRWHQTTPLGKVLDPIVDIVFNLAMLSGLTAAGLLSRWVFWMGVARYGSLLVGVTGLYLFFGPVRIAPTSFGRMSGVVMSSLIALFTLLYAIRGGMELGITRLTEIALGVMLAATTIQMIGVGWFNLRMLTGHAREAGAVVEDVHWGTR